MRRTKKQQTSDAVGRKQNQREHFITFCKLELFLEEKRQMDDYKTKMT